MPNKFIQNKQLKLDNGNKLEEMPHNASNQLNEMVDPLVIDDDPEDSSATLVDGDRSRNYSGNFEQYDTLFDDQPSMINKIACFPFIIIHHGYL